MSEDNERLERYARLAVQVGLNLQPGQILGINALIEHAPFARAIARAAYAAGAKYVDVLYTDQHVRRAHIELADEELLGYSPPWLVTRLRELGEIGGASARFPATRSRSCSRTSTARESARPACARSPKSR